MTCDSLFFFNDTATTEIYTLSLHDALPICYLLRNQYVATPHVPVHLSDTFHNNIHTAPALCWGRCRWPADDRYPSAGDRKSTRLNSSHANISYAVFCLKKKNSPEPSTLLWR